MPAVNASPIHLRWDVILGPTIGSVGEEVYELLIPLAREDNLTGWSLKTYIGAITGMYQEAADWGRDVNGRPGWAVLMDLNTCPDKALPWLAQFVGVDIVGLSPAAARAKMLDQPQRRRGTPQGLRDAVRATLTGTQSITVQERTDGYSVDPPWDITVLTTVSEHTSKTVPTAVENKFAGLQLSMHGYRQEWGRVKHDYATWQDVKNHYSTWNDVKLWLPS